MSATWNLASGCHAELAQPTRDPLPAQSQLVQPKFVSRRSDVRCRTKVSSGQNWKVALWLSASIVVGALGMAAVVGDRIWRNTWSEAALRAAQADYAWYRPTRESLPNVPACLAQTNWADHIGYLLAFDIGSVSIRQHLNDRQLGFVAYLRDVHSFELRSDRATDKTLEVVSRLPNLRYLTIVGEQFSVMGLLQLRNAPSLERVRFDSEKLTPIEFAVLKAALAQVDFYDVDAAPHQLQPLACAS